MDSLELGSLPNNKLSYSAYNMFLRCPSQFMYRYLEGLKERPNSNLIVGRGTHGGLEWSHKEALKVGNQPKLRYVIDATAAAVDAALKEVPASEIEWKNGDSSGKVLDDSVSLVSVYDDVRAGIRPTKVEEGFEIALKGTDYSIVGRIDLFTAGGELVDYKTSARTPSDNAAEVSDQLTLYDIDRNATSLEIHALVRTKTPQVKIIKSAPRSPERVTDLLQNIQKVSLLIRTGIFTKAAEDAPNSPCSWCGFYERCRGKKRPE